jgi:hypothetical protein
MPAGPPRDMRLGPADGRWPRHPSSASRSVTSQPVSSSPRPESLSTGCSIGRFPDNAALFRIHPDLDEKVARTIADLEACESIQSVYVAHAVQYRALDRRCFR